MCESGNLLNVFIWLIHRNSIESKFEIIHSISHIQLKIIVPLTFSVVFPNNNSSHKTWNPFSFVMINLNCESLFFFIVFNNAEASVCKPNLLKIMSIEFFLYGGFFFKIASHMLCFSHSWDWKKKRLRVGSREGVVHST